MSAEEREKWDAIHAERGFFPPVPSALITDCLPLLPPAGGRALDVGGGSGRHALWLAECGYQVTLVDVSGVALELARTEAAKHGIVLEVLCVDLESDPFPKGPWDVILSCHYLHRPLFARFAAELSPEGILVLVQPTVRNLERHAKPGRRFLLEEGELRDLASANGLEAISYQEEWSPGGRHEARLIARRVA